MNFVNWMFSFNFRESGLLQLFLQNWDGKMCTKLQLETLEQTSGVNPEMPSMIPNSTR